MPTSVPGVATSSSTSQVRLPCRHRKTRLAIPLQAQQHNEVTIPTLKLREIDRALQQKQKTFMHREIDCAICQRGYRSSQKNRRQRSASIFGKHPKTLLKIPTKWHPGSTVFKLTSPKDRNCEVCKKTKITRAPGEKREKFDDSITAEHIVLNEDGESRNKRRYAVVVQDLATEWIQSIPRTTKTSQETERSLRKFLKPSEKPKVV